MITDKQVIKWTEAHPTLTVVMALALFTIMGLNFGG